MRLRWVSPPGLVVAAAAIGVLYGAAHLLGLREDTTILSGTVPAAGDAGALRGLVYIALYFAWVIGAPILLLGAAVLWAAERAVRGRSQP